MKLLKPLTLGSSKEVMCRIQLKNQSSSRSQKPGTKSSYMERRGSSKLSQERVLGTMAPDAWLWCVSCFSLPMPFLSSPLLLCYNRISVRTGNKAGGCSTKRLPLRTWACGNHLIKTVASEWMSISSNQPPLYPPGQTTAGRKRRNEGQCTVSLDLPGSEL